MFSLRDLRFVLCSLDLNVLRAQRIIGFFILITHKSTRSDNPITWKYAKQARNTLFLFHWLQYGWRALELALRPVYVNPKKLLGKGRDRDLKNEVSEKALAVELLLRIPRYGDSKESRSTLHYPLFIPRD